MNLHGAEVTLMEKHRPSTYAWIGIVGAVAVYDVFCPKGELMSERADEWIDNPAKRIVFGAAVGTIALHLTNVLPQRYDPLHYSLRWKNVSA